MKFHLSLNVENLQKSVDFYQILFGIEPTKYYPDYVKFEIESPPLVFCLEPLASSGLGSQKLNHFGLRLEKIEDVLKTAERLNANGLEPHFIEDIECCYSKQSKVVLNDPDGNMIEFYILMDNLEKSSPAQSSHFPSVTDISENRHSSFVAKATAGVLKAASGVLKAANLVSQSFDHMIGSPVPESFGPENSLQAVRLRGTFNIMQENLNPMPVLEKSFKALKSGGELTLHLLTSDINLSQQLPQLPGPAALVQCAPREIDIIEWLEQSGFEAITIERLSHAPVFRFENANLRELLIKAKKSDNTISETGNDHVLVYRGPFVSVISGSGQVYRQGRRVKANYQEVHQIKKLGLQDNFIFLDN